MGRYDEALPLYQRALEGRRAALGASYPDTLASLNGEPAALFVDNKQRSRLDVSYLIYSICEQCAGLSNRATA